MSQPIVKCPNCGQRIPAPLEDAGLQEIRVLCESCGVSLRLHRKQPAEGKTPAPTRQPTITRIPGYRLMGRLGRGGMGSVFSGVQTASGRLVAIKVLLPSSASNPDLVLRFEREAKMLASLTHPNVVQIIDRGQVGNINYIVMEYIPGRTLKDRMDEGRLPLKEILDILTHVGEAIQHCHDHGLVHRDLKPGNILLTPVGEVKVTDFGISGLVRRMGDITEEGALIGTPQYVAPEQLRDGSRIDHRADQYSLAILAYEMLTNSLPIGVFDPVSTRRADTTPRLDAVIGRALARDPADRFRSMREFTHEFRKSLPSVSTPPPGLSVASDAPTEATAGKAASPPFPRVPAAVPGATNKIENPSEADTLAPLPPRPLKESTTTAAASTVPSGSSSPLFPVTPGVANDATTSDKPAPVPTVSATSHRSEALTPEPSSDEFSVTMSLDARARTDADAARETKPAWTRVAAPHRFAILGMLCLLAVGIGSIVFRQWVAAEPNAYRPQLADGTPFPPSFLPPITQLSELGTSLSGGGKCLYLFADRTETGAWDLAPNVFATAQRAHALEDAPVQVVEAGLAPRLGRYWTWEHGTGMVLATTASRDETRSLVLAMAAPLHPLDVTEACQMLSRYRSSWTLALPPALSLASRDLLVNGDFLIPVEASDSGSAGWHPLGSPALSGIAEDGRVLSRRPPVLRELHDFAEDPFLTLDPDGAMQGIWQSAVVETGQRHALRITARAHESPAWLVVSTAPPPSGPVHDRLRDPVWTLAVELAPRWRTFEIRFVPADPDETVAVALRSRTNRVDLRSVSLRHVSP